jgi:hypothetical protein
LASWNHANPSSYNAADPGAFYKGNFWYNMFSYFDNVENLTRNDRLYGDVNLTYNFNNDLKLRGAFRKNYSVNTGENKTFYLLESSATQTGTKASYSTAQSFFNDDRLELTASYTKKIKDFNIDLCCRGRRHKDHTDFIISCYKKWLVYPGLFFFKQLD